MSLLQCKKCNGPHLTIKCGKEPIKEIVISTKPHVYFNKTKQTTVKISNLPDDITVNELDELIRPWGNIGRINLNNFENKSSYIDFNIRSEADYFVEALNRTPFDNLIIRVEIVDR
jgi:RNA recognition motif-containing protein